MSSGETEIRLMTPAQVATRWGCSIDVVYAALNEGRLPGVKIGESNGEGGERRHWRCGWMGCRWATVDELKAALPIASIRE